MTMTSSSSSCSPSSSAVTIPIPGKSILKRPPPTQTGILSRIRGFLPTQPSSSTSDELKPLKRAHFILPQLSIVYPFSSVNPPSTPTLKEEKKAIEEREAERRKRVLRGNSIGPNDTEEWWSLDKVESFYRECCESREEPPDPAVSAAFKRAASASPRSVDLSGVQLTPTSAAILSDVFSIEWGLRKLTLRECDLDEAKLKVVLHALLIPGTLAYLSVASNRGLKTPAFKVIGAYASKAKSLQFLDLSQTHLDKKAVEYVTACLTTAPEPGLVSLRLDDCALRPNALEILSRVVRTSSLRNISLRHNRISATGAVALALMIRDYPDVALAPSPITSPSPSTSSSILPSTTPSLLSPQSSPLPGTAPLPPPSRSGPVLPPPRHPGSSSLQTTYTPYIPRSKRGAAAAQTQAHQAADARVNPVPLITSSAGGGVTTRVESLANGHGHGHGPGPGGISMAGKHDDGLSAALLDKVRALDALPRLGALRTLDLRGNDLRNGVTYLAQVLKRNRTLKVLNLSENKLDVQCLVAIAEALKYNQCLETLDLSRNPCCGPALEGIQSLRTAFTLNAALKRLFLSSTQLTSSGAIALAEFLPESRSLLHLDLTDNKLDLAGVMALSRGVQGNWVIRCLDLNIPPDDEEFARMCREILNTCIRNTEAASKASKATATQTNGKDAGKGVWGLIEESELARSIRRDDAKKQDEASVATRAEAFLAQIEKARSDGAGAVKVGSTAWLDATISPAVPPSPSSPVLPSSSPTSSANLLPQEIEQKARELVNDLTVQIQSTAEASKLEPLLSLCDRLNAVVSNSSTSRPTLGLKTQGLGVAELASGHILHTSPAPMSDDEDDEPPTPRVDKGKGRAEPEPEEHEKVLSPSFMISESEDEGSVEGTEAVAVSPTDRSKSWVEEEGEIFRKGAVLLGPEEMEGEYAGEELRRELLEAMVERPPPRSIVDDFGMDLSLSPVISEEPPRSPIAEEPQSQKLPPQPYLSRNRSTSSNSVHTLTSPTSESNPRTPTSPTGPLSPGGRGSGVVRS
ncbi:hypothetical protein F5141DRAFT_1141856 [Pisolithus sp. B1]|nr:hypothetical protein F5141DRAFT_1141856 [Pisolithus sp. B1]